MGEEFRLNSRVNKQHEVIYWFNDVVYKGEDYSDPNYARADCGEVAMIRLINALTDGQPILTYTNGNGTEINFRWNGREFLRC